MVKVYSLTVRKLAKKIWKCSISCPYSAKVQNFPISWRQFPNP